ncbi:MAG: hypothetical protein Kow00128_04310 [Deltaproteobacteria bacterium]
MNGDLTFQGTFLALDSRQRRMFRLAVAASVVFHALGFLTSPYWQPSPENRSDVITVDLADIPAGELPSPPSLPAAPARTEADAKTPAPATPPPPPPTREQIRERVASKGVLRMLSRGRSGSAGADPLSRIRVPGEIRSASRAAPAPEDYRPRGAPPGDLFARKAPAPGIGRQIESSEQSSTALSSQVFRTDSGLEGEIRGPIVDRNRSAGAIASTVRSYQSGIKYVYNRELLANPGLSGKITVAFVILPDGRVQSAEIRSSSVNWPALEQAVLRRMRHWKFPKSEGGPVRVTFPFVFHPEM